MHFLFARTIKLGRIAGIEIEIDWSWFIVFVLVFSSLAFQFFPQAYGFSTTLSVALGLGSTILFFTSVLLHELAHSIVANRHGVAIKKIILFVFGGVASLSGEPGRPAVEFKIAIAGPLTSLVLSGAFYGLALLSVVWSLPVAAAFEYLSLINLVVAIFNLLPGYPLDGGRILRAVIWRWSNLERATRIAARGGMLVGYLIVAYGVFQFVYLGNVFALVWLGLIGFFLVSAARESIVQTALTAVLSSIKVRELLEPHPVIVSATLDVRSFVRQVLLGRKRISALVSNRGRIIGEVHLEQVRQLPVATLAKRTVRDIMQPIDRQHYLQPGMSATRALYKLASGFGGSGSTGFEQLPVYERGRLLGSVSRDTLRVYLAVRTDILNRDPHARARI
ncbi:MAG: site-2 protease family protein [Parcubacteria group bacterium]